MSARAGTLPGSGSVASRSLGGSPGRGAGRGRTAFRDFTRFYTPYALDDLETETLLTLATADDRAYATVPEAVRELINTQYLLPTGSRNQMFGRGLDIQASSR